MGGSLHIAYLDQLRAWRASRETIGNLLSRQARLFTPPGGERGKSPGHIRQGFVVTASLDGTHHFRMGTAMTGRPVNPLTGTRRAVSASFPHHPSVRNARKWADKCRCCGQHRHPSTSREAAFE